MKNYKKLIAGVVIVIVIVLVTVVGLVKTNKTDNNLKIGVISSLTGLVLGGDNLGQGFANGFLLAHEEYMAKNPNAKIEFVLEDDGYDSKKGVSAYQKLISIDKVNAVVNLSSVTLDATKSLLNQADIPVVQVFAETEISEDNIYQIYPDQTAVGTLGDVADQDGAKKVVIAHPQIQAYAKFISDFDAAYDGELVIESFSPTEKNMSSVALKIKEANPDGLVVFMGSVEGAQLMKELRTLGYKPKNVYFDIGLQFGVEDYSNVLGDLSFMNGSKGLYLAVSGGPEFQAKYQKRFNAKTPMLAALGYDSYNVMIKNYDSNTGKWRNNMNSYKVSGASGEISFTPAGVRPANWSISLIENGEVVVK